jgi:phosphoenolpyruvate carboxykinase (GTP)
MVIFTDENKAKLDALNNPKVWKVVNMAIELMEPAEVQVFDDSPESKKIIRENAKKYKEEKPLALPGHTIHYDSYFDQGRDKLNTATLLPEGQKLGWGLEYKEREAALKDVFQIMKGLMKGRIMIIRFYSLGPVGCKHSLNSLQITDSWYVAHSEDILYRLGYESFKKLKNKDDFFYFIHSQGELDERNTTKNIKDRRIFIDPLEKRVLTVNNQYAGNSLACKKLSLRLAIDKANHEDWLAEHYFISAFYPPKGGRKTYFAGAYPSACGKTSTAMIPGCTIVGDDIAYIFAGNNGECRGVNVEQGIFGIIKDVNAKDDPEIFKALTEPKELIFSNVLHTDDGKVYWEGMGNIEYPTEGYNHAGKWKKGDKDAKGATIPLSHPNSRFTLSLNDLTNKDGELDNPNGVKIDAILYGGRDSDTTVPVLESLNWQHGVYIGTVIESETTAATLGQVGKRELSPMSNIDFLIVPFGLYITNHMKFGKKLKTPPKIFGTNYFLKSKEGQYLNGKLDKKVWILWAEGRVHGDYEAIKSPVGYLPKYEDLKNLFATVFNGKVYSKEEYVQQFSIRIDKYLEKADRMEAIFKAEEGMPKEFWDAFNAQKQGLLDLKAKFGKNEVSPFEL